MIEIPWRELPEEALLGLIEEFVTREGTDYGEREVELQEKVKEVVSQLELGTAIITFDTESESATIVSARDRPSDGKRL